MLLGVRHADAARESPKGREYRPRTAPLRHAPIPQPISSATESSILDHWTKSFEVKLISSRRPVFGAEKLIVGRRRLWPAERAPAYPRVLLAGRNPGRDL